MKPWLTVKEAATLVGRHQSQIYRWIDRGRLSSRTAPDGTIEVPTDDATRAEADTRRGRPKGTPTRR